MQEVLQSLLNGAIFDRVFSFCRRTASRLFKRLKRASVRAIWHILDTAQSVLNWLRRIGEILGRGLMRPFEPIRDLFRTLVMASQMRLKPVGSASLPSKGKGRKHPMNGRSFGTPRSTY
jgi:hypothetical protein